MPQLRTDLGHRGLPNTTVIAAEGDPDGGWQPVGIDYPESDPDDGFNLVPDVVAD